jgi:hypothetical protein
MKDTHVDAYYIGKLYDEDDVDWFFSAEVTGHREKNGKRYETREWDLAAFIDDAKQFPVDQYTVSQVQAIIKVTGLAREWTKKGCRIDIVLVRITTEITTVGENANPLIQLAMLAPEE